MTSDEDDAFKSLPEEGKADALSPTLEAILQNARRLLDDACLLYDHERFASATALAILAMEEAGKYFIVEWGSKKGSVARNLNQHIAKQHSFASVLFSKALADELDAHVEKMGFAAEAGEPTEEQRQWMDSDAGRSFKARILRDMDTLVQRALVSEDGNLIATVRRKELDKLKQSCIYVDLNEKSEVLADPADITQETANRFLRLVRPWLYW